MNVLNFIKPKANLPRNGFDLSQRHLFSAKAGQLLPILSLECVPGDYHEINVLEMARSMQVHTDAFCRMKQNFDFYFVPYSQIWPRFNDFVSQNEDPVSIDFDSSLNDTVPYFSYEDLNRVLYTEGSAHDDLDVHGFSFREGAKRLLDLTGFGDAYTQDAFDGSTGIKYNPFRLCAYQKIFYDYYRQPFYDLELPSGDVFAYAFSLASNSTSVSSQLPYFLTLHYRQWKKDFFTGLIPTVQFGAVSFVDLGNFSLRLDNAPQGARVLGSNTLGSIGYGSSASSASSITPGTFSSTAHIDVYQILKAQALQKWKENVARAGSHTIDNMRAHYGVAPSFEQDMRARFVGSFDAPLTIDEVIATNQTSDNTLGEIGGKGIGTAQGKIKFNCDDFGVLMCIYSIIPTAEYNALGVDKANTLLEHFDFWTPEFDNCGMEPIALHQLFSLRSFAESHTEYAQRQNTILGYAPRNLHLKLSYDKVHGEFMAYNLRVSESGQEMIRPVNGVFSHWAIPRQRIGYGAMSLDNYYVSPSDLDSIFVQSADDYQSSDQFIVNCNFDIKSVRNMPVLGLPNW